MVGVAESYLGAFAVELGHTGERLALLSTLPLLAGACCQLFSPKLCVWLGSRKRVAIAGALGQTASLGLFLALAASANRELVPLLLAHMVFWISAGCMAPAWNAWMATLTVHTHRPRYFALRSAFNHVALLIAFGAAGYALQRAGVQVLHCFVALFGVGFLARLSSVGALLAQVDIAARAHVAQGDASILPRLRHTLGRGQFRVAGYLALLAFGTQLSAPFFTPYMLRELRLDYAQFATLAALSILTKAITFPCCHRIAEGVGLRRLLTWAGVGVAFIPVVWAVSSEFHALIAAHVLGGVFWAAVEYASFQLLLDAAPSDHTAEFFSLSNALTGVAQIAGAMSGGVLLERLGYSQVFMLSALLRAAPLALLFLVLRPALVPSRVRALYARLVDVRPIAGAAHRSILAASEVPRLMGNRTTDPPPAL